MSTNLSGCSGWAEDAETAEAADERRLSAKARGTGNAATSSSALPAETPDSQTCSEEPDSCEISYLLALSQ